MESPGQKFDRLLKALDELVREEAALIAAANYPAIQEVQQRAEPLIEALTKLAPKMRASTVRARVDSLLKRRQQNIDLLESRLTVVKTELTALQKSTQQVARIAPVYGRAPSRVGPSHLRVSG